MSDNKNELYPDISGLFDIDDKDIPEEIIKKDPTIKPAGAPILNSDEALKALPKESRKAITKDKKARKHKAILQKTKKKFIIAIASVIAIILAAGIISFLISESQKPVVKCEKPVTETISLHTDSIGITYSDGQGIQIVFIDNEYDTNNITVGQTAEITSTEIKTTGTVSLIREEQPDSQVVTEYYSGLSADASDEKLPETAVYAVYITPSEPESFTSAGKPVSIKVLTKTSEDTLTVPSSAVISDESGTYVWVYSIWSKAISKNAVTTGISSDGRTEITDGLKKSSRVIYDFSENTSSLAEGVKVKVIK